MSLKKILITGASGYIGARLSQCLARAGYQVAALCYPAVPQQEQWLSLMDRVVLGDITDCSVIETMTDSYYDVLIHLVSLDHRQSESDPQVVYRVNVQPLWNLLYHFSRKGNLKRCVYFSTVQVYGKTSDSVISEQTPVGPVNAYGLTHWLCEEICNYYNRNGQINCVNLRLSNSYGDPVFKDANCWWLVVNDLCRQAVENGRICLLSDGSPQRDFIHHRDIVEAVKAIIRADKLFCSTYNLCSGQTFTIGELAYIVKRCVKQKIERDIEIYSAASCQPICALPANQSKSTWSNSKLREMGFRPSTELCSGIESLLEYLNQDIEK